MNTKYLHKMIAGTLYGLAILMLVFSVTGIALAQDPNPWFTVFPEQGFVEGWDWPLGEQVLLIIDDPDTLVSPDYSQIETVIWEYEANWVWFDFSSGYTTKPGDSVTVSLLDGDMARTHVVQSLSITGIDPYENIVFGTANEGQIVVLWSWEDPESRRIETDSSGDWSVDFDDIGFDLEPGFHVRAEVWVESNDTAVDWEVPAYYDIYTYDPQTGETVLITKNLRETGEYDPTWSPDGKMIAHDVVSSDSHDIYITKVKSGVSKELRGADGGNDASWSPKGDWIAFDRRWVGDESIYVVPADGGKRKLVREDAVSANWAPSGKRIVFRQPSDGSIRTIAFDGGKGGETLVAEYGETPAWSPDGNWIAFNRDGDIWKVQVDNLGEPLGDPIQLTSNPFQDGKPTWTPDSQTIIYDSNFGQDSNLWSVPAAGGTPTWLAGAPIFGEYGPANARKDIAIAFAGFSSQVQAPRLWVAAYTYDLLAGSFTENGEYPYHFEFEWNYPEPGAFSGQGGDLDISSDAPVYDGYVLLRGERELRGIKYPDGLSCEEVGEINPDQPMRFLIGWLPDYGMTYSDALTHFESLTGRVVWDDGVSAELTPHEIIPFSFNDLDAWFNYACTFTEAPLKMDLRVNYGDDWVESFYEAGHEVIVTVTESDGETIKATATAWTESKDFWGGETGFQTAPEDWDPELPDLLPYDWVYAQVDNGATARVQIGDIQGDVNIFTDSVSGTVMTTWFDEPVQIECLDWGSGGETPFDNKDGGLVPADGSERYFCSWEGEWDIQPGQNVGVGYVGPDGHWVANVFYNDRIADVGNFNIAWSQTNPEEVIYLSWNGSENLTNPWKHPNCQGDLEFFGNSWVTETEVFWASLVGWGTTGDWSQADSAINIQSMSSDCPGSADIPINTQYQFFDEKPDLMKVERTFEFGETPYEQNVRPFIPRLFPKIGFTEVWYLDSNGYLHTSGTCETGCLVNDWDGTWFAIHDPVTGLGMIAQHVPSTGNVALWLDDDDGSLTNATSFLLLQPDEGFTGNVMETEYLCFYDSSTWSPSLMTLPDGCLP